MIVSTVVDNPAGAATGIFVAQSLSMSTTDQPSPDQECTSADKVSPDAPAITTAGAPFEVRVPTGTDDPLSDAEIRRYRQEIDRLDRVIIDAVKRRAQVSGAIGKTRMGSGGTRLVHTREVAIINNFIKEIGEEGATLAGVLLRMGRGKL